MGAQLPVIAKAVCIFPCGIEGALLLEQYDEWAITRRYMSLKTLAGVSDNRPIRLPAIAA